MGKVTIEGEEYAVPDAVCDLLRSVSEERDTLRELARNVCICRVEHIGPLEYYKHMDRICAAAHRMVSRAADA